MRAMVLTMNARREWPAGSSVGNECSQAMRAMMLAMNTHREWPADNSMIMNAHR